VEKSTLLHSYIRKGNDYYKDRLLYIFKNGPSIYNISLLYELPPASFISLHILIFKQFKTP
jgi:hypothetical protein